MTEEKCEHVWVPDEYDDCEPAPDVCIKCLKSKDEVMLEPESDHCEACTSQD